MTRIRDILWIIPAAALVACGDDAASIPDDDANSGFDQTESDGMYTVKPASRRVSSRS